MGAPAYDLSELDFEDPDDPDVAALLKGGAVNDNAEPPPDDSDLFDAPAANDNAAPEEIKAFVDENFADAPLAGSPLLVEQDKQAYAADGLPMPARPQAPSPPDAPNAGLQALADTARGAGQGATLRWGDEGAAALAEAAPREGSGLDALARRALNVFGADLPEVDPEAAAIPKTYAAGSRYADMRDSERAANAQAQERSPVLYTAGEVAGAVPGAIATAPAAGGALPARVAANMAAGAAYGGISGGGGSEAQDAMGVAADAVQGAEVGAVLGGGITAAAAGAGRAAQAVRPGLERLANRARAGASGAYGGELAKLTERHGPQYAERLGADIERLGLHKRQGPLKSAALGAAGGTAIGGTGGAAYGAGKSYFTGEGDMLDEAAKYGKRGAKMGAALGALSSRVATPAVYRENAAAVRKAAGQQLDDAIREATEQGVHAPTTEVLAGMRAKLRATPKSTREHRALREQIRDLMSDVKEQHGPQMNPKQLQALKKAYEAPETGGFEPTANTPVSDAAKARMYQRLASVPRKALSTSIDELALPETAAKFGNAKRDFGPARTVENLATKREAQELGNQMVSLPAAATGDPLGALSVEGMKRYGKGALAGTLRGTERKFGGLQTLAESLSGQRAATGATAVPTGQTAGFAAGASIPSRAAPAMASEQQRSEATGNANGYRLEGAVRDAMARNPQALGPYAQQVQKAMSDSDPKALSSLLFTLSQDETFRTQIAPALTGAPQ